MLLDHRQRRETLGVAVGLRHAGVDDEVAAVLHQRMAEEGGPRLRPALLR